MPATNRVEREFVDRLPILSPIATMEQISVYTEEHIGNLNIFVWGGTSEVRNRTMSTTLITKISAILAANPDWGCPNPEIVFHRGSVSASIGVGRRYVTRRQRERNRIRARDLRRNLHDNMAYYSYTDDEIMSALVIPTKACGQRTCPQCASTRGIPVAVIGLTETEYAEYVEVRLAQYRNNLRSDHEDEEYRRQDAERRRQVHDQRHDEYLHDQHLSSRRMYHDHIVRLETRGFGGLACFCGCGARATRHHPFASLECLTKCERIYEQYLKGNMSGLALTNYPPGIQAVLIDCKCCHKVKYMPYDTQLLNNGRPWNWLCDHCANRTCRCFLLGVASQLGVGRDQLSRSSRRLTEALVVEFPEVNPEEEVSHDDEWFYEAVHANGCQCHYCQHSLIYDPRLGFARPAGRPDIDFDVEEYRRRHLNETRRVRERGFAEISVHDPGLVDVDDMEITVSELFPDLPNDDRYTTISEVQSIASNRTGPQDLDMPSSRSVRHRVVIESEPALTTDRWERTIDFTTNYTRIEEIDDVHETR